MSGLTEAVKYLNRTPARVASSEDLHRSLSLINPDKYITRSTSRVIKKVPLVFYLPNYTRDSVFRDAFIPWQFNYSFPADFYLTKFELFQQFYTGTSHCNVCLRYRIGDTAYRYVLPYSHLGIVYHDEHFEPYNSQVIKKNFVIEIWTRVDRLTPFPQTVGTNNANNALGFRFETSLQADPATTDQLEVVGSNSVFVRDELFNLLDEDIPTTYNALGPWLDNV